MYQKAPNLKKIKQITWITSCISSLMYVELLKYGKYICNHLCTTSAIIKLCLSANVTKHLLQLL